MVCFRFSIFVSDNNNEVTDNKKRDETDIKIRRSYTM